MPSAPPDDVPAGTAAGLVSGLALAWAPELLGAALLGAGFGVVAGPRDRAPPETLLWSLAYALLGALTALVSHWPATARAALVAVATVSLPLLLGS